MGAGCWLACHECGPLLLLLLRRGAPEATASCPLPNAEGCTPASAAELLGQVSMAVGPRSPADWLGSGGWGGGARHSPTPWISSGPLAAKGSAGWLALLAEAVGSRPARITRSGPEYGNAIARQAATAPVCLLPPGLSAWLDAPVARRWTLAPHLQQAQSTWPAGLPWPHCPCGQQAQPLAAGWAGRAAARHQRPAGGQIWHLQRPPAAICWVPAPGRLCCEAASSQLAVPRADCCCLACQWLQALLLAARWRRMAGAVPPGVQPPAQWTRWPRVLPRLRTQRRLGTAVCYYLRRACRWRIVVHTR